MAWDKVGYAPCIFCLTFALGNQKQAFWLPGAFSFGYGIKRIVSAPNHSLFYRYVYKNDFQAP